VSSHSPGSTYTSLSRKSGISCRHDHLVSCRRRGRPIHRAGIHQQQEKLDFLQLPNYRIYLKLMINGSPSESFSAVILPMARTNRNSTILWVDTNGNALGRESISAVLFRWAPRAPLSVEPRNHTHVYRLAFRDRDHRFGHCSTRNGLGPSPPFRMNLLPHPIMRRARPGVRTATRTCLWCKEQPRLGDALGSLG
jgi:hypothetical protein